MKEYYSPTAGVVVILTGCNTNGKIRLLGQTQFFAKDSLVVFAPNKALL